MDRASTALLRRIGHHLGAEGAGWFGVVAVTVALFPWIGLLAGGNALQVILMHVIFCFGTLILLFSAPAGRR